MVLNPDFYRGKNVFVTGHTGFKGIWLCKMLEMFGANVTGYALASPTSEGAEVFAKSGVERGMTSVIGDVRDFSSLEKAFAQAKPELVFHLAAQPIVLESYRDPVGTYSTNVMGTVNLLECIRQSDCVRSFVNVTTDKVYENKEWPWGYRENEPLDGFDPYSNSKSCSELATHSYQKSFFADGRVAISTARAGNVIGGGDFSPNRIIPDCIRAAYAGEDIAVRNPYSTRPYQHVLEPLYAYLLIAEKQYNDVNLAGWYNVGPDECDCLTTGELTELFCRLWGSIKWHDVSVEAPHEARFLKLDCSKLKETMGWRPRWHIDMTMQKTIEWAKAWQTGDDIASLMEKQIREFFSCHSLQEIR